MDAISSTEVMMTIASSPMFCVIVATNYSTLVAAAKGASDAYEEETKTKPTHIWLHPDWEEKIDADNFHFDTMLKPVFDPLKKSPSHAEVGIHKEPAQWTNGSAPGVSTIHGNMWQAFQTSDPGVGGILLAIQENAARFTEKTGLIPTHVSLHKSWIGKEQTVLDETGLNLVFEPPMPYPINGYVGVRDIKNTSIAVEKSSNVKSFSFFPDVADDNGVLIDTGTLFITFSRKPKKGSADEGVDHYQYDNVPERVYKELLGAESKGSFISKRVKGKFPTTKLNE